MRLNNDLITHSISEKLFSIKKLYHKSKSNHRLSAYVERCANLFIEAFKGAKSYSKRKVLYFNLFGYDYNNEEFISLNKYLKNFYIKNRFNSKIFKCYEIGTQCIHQDKMLSISSKIVKERINFVFLSTNQIAIDKINKNLPFVPTFNLNKYKAKFTRPRSVDDYVNIDYDEYCMNDILSFAKQLKIKPSEKDLIRQIIVNLRVHKITYPDCADTYIYYIRPRVLHQEFIGSFYLVMNQELELEHLNQLSHFAMEVFAETAIDRIRKYQNQIIVNQLNKELSHTWNHYFQGLKNVIENEILPPAYENKLGDLERVKDLLLSRVSSASLVHRFFTYLHKSGESLENQKLPDEVKAALQKEEINLKQLLKDVILSLRDYYADSSQIYLFEQKCISNLLVQVKKIKTTMIFNSKIAIEIILFNLLKNAITQAANTESFISLSIINTKFCLDIKIKNKGLMHREWLSYINSPNSDNRSKVSNFEYSFGINTIMRIQAVEYLKVRGKAICTKAQNNYREQTTTFTLKIPNI